VVPPAEAPRALPSDRTSAYGAGNGFTAYPGLVSTLGLVAAADDARPSAQSIGELALPRFAAGEGVAAVDAAPLYVRQRVALTAVEQAAGARL
jgi:tRNA threonylcarbamoyladenosine biosynthesis protein TsaB